MLSILLEVILEAAPVVTILTIMRVAASRGPDPDLSTFGPLGPGE